MIKVHTLDNGLRIVMEAMPSVRSISFGIWVRNGSRNEDASTNGISHFIEHMLFKGTETRSAKDIADIMDEVGGQINAYTSKEYTCYYTRTLDTHFDVALDILTDMFFHSKFDAADIVKERNVILEEINMYEDTPEDLVHDILQNSAWPSNPLGQTILGTPDSIGAFDREGIIRYFQANYHPQNTVVAIAGNLDEPEMIQKISDAFSGFAKLPDFTPVSFDTVYKPTIITREKDIEQVHMCLGFPGVASGSEETYTMAAVNTIFGGGMSSRLFQKIREEHGLAYSVYSYNAGFADTGMFTVYAALSPAQVHDVLNLTLEEIRRMFTDRVTQKQLSKSREQLKSNYILSLESSSNRMNSIGRTMLMQNKTVTAEQLIEKIDAIDLDMFYTLCEKVMQLDKISLSLVGKNIEGMIPDAERVFNQANG